jgi:hypothetical protein
MKKVPLRRGDSPVMTRGDKSKQVKIEKPPTPRRLPVPKCFRRDIRAKKNQNGQRRNDGASMRTGRIMGMNWDPGAIHFPKHKKLKGWKKENRKYRKVL